ncbi:hypothetical protein N9I98_01110 [Flavobacteriales bacterium]|nr:hypothetical protein [Flavobacteriales bacterium]
MKNNNLFLKDHTELLNIQNQGNITVAQISYDTAVLDSIISLHEAFDENLIIVKELEESERVNTIELENLSESYIFILDGDILKGAKQNRVVNTSVLVAPKSKIILPVSCVEEGRWEYKSSRFKPSDEIAHRSIRYSKANYISESKKLNRVDFVADQSTVWNKVASVSDSLEFHSKTMSHSDLFENYKEELEDISKKFKMQPKANGLLIFVGNQMVACDIFNNNKIYRDYFNKIIKTSAIDSKIKKDNDHLISLDKAIIMQSLNDIFDQFEKSKENASFTPGVSEGVETRLNLDDNTFYGLSHKGESVHQSILSSSSK